MLVEEAGLFNHRDLAKLVTQHLREVAVMVERLVVVAV